MMLYCHILRPIQIYLGMDTWSKYICVSTHFILIEECPNGKEWKLKINKMSIKWRGKKYHTIGSFPNLIEKL